MTSVDVVASLHSPRPGRIACIVRNAGIARIARIARNDCNDEETSNDGTAYSTPVAGISRQICVISEQFPKLAHTQWDLFKKSGTFCPFWDLLPHLVLCSGFITRLPTG